MGREKQYDRSELLQRAMQLFWRRGYTSTSTAELVQELGVNRKSMYSEFGSKEALFQAALEHYNRNVMGHLLAPIEADDASIGSIKELFRSFVVAGEGKFKGLGCLMCNTANERSSIACDIDQYVEEYFERIQQGFRRALENAQKNLEFTRPIDTGEMASFLTTCLIGTVSSIRASAPGANLRSTHRMICDLMDSLRTKDWTQP
jgi:TetR/AcrR family transcriptional repressor of nem operon